MKIDNWIFVTGAPRSGTTFVGRLLSAPLSVDYIHEPFNPDCGIPGIDRRFLYLRRGSEEAERLRATIAAIFRYDFRLRTGYYPNDPRLRRLVKRLVGSRGPFHLRLAKLNPFHRAAVIKDPIGCLLAAYLADEYRIKPVILVRHPVAFVASVLRLGWRLSLEPIRDQPHLVEDHFADDGAFLEARRENPVEQAAALWRALNKVLLAQAEAHPGWELLRHEDVSREPVKQLRRLYERHGLSWSMRVEKRIRARTGSHNPVEAKGGRVQDFRRDSTGLFERRLRMLEREKRRRVFEITGDVALGLYPEESFALDEKA
ncbi:MAG: sulfotransferase [Gemmatimonadota bacterium]